MSDSLGDNIQHLRDVTERKIEELAKRLENTDRQTPRRQKTNREEELEEVSSRQQALLERVMESAALIGEVVSVNKNEEDGSDASVIISCYGRLLSVKPLSGVKLGAGDMVRLAPNSSQIISVIERFNVGSICIVRKVIDGNFSEVDFNGSIRVVMNGKYGERVQADDRVVLDSSGSTIVAYMGRTSSRFQLGSKPNIRWDDICGLEDAKRQLQEMVEMSVKYPKLFKYYNLKQPNGALIYGPPGCGKTMLLEAVANAISELHGAQAVESGFINVKGPEILDMYVGNSERNIRALFLLAKKHKEKHGYPAVIAIDEAESILSRRGSGVSSDMEKTVVPTFLAEMNGIDDSSAIVLLCTNRQDVLDPAVIRDKRIDRNIRVSRPDRKSAEAIFRSNLNKYPVRGNADELVRRVAEEFYSDKYKMYEVTRRKEDKEEVLTFKLADLINGAMAVGVVEKAVWQAFQRDRANNAEAEVSKRTGVTGDDLAASVAETYHQKSGLNHRDELTEFVADFREDLVGLPKKVKQAQAQKG